MPFGSEIPKVSGAPPAKRLRAAFRDRAFYAGGRIPLNELHAKGVLSTGCVPCNGAPEPGEAEHAHRRWRECGQQRVTA